MNNNSETLIIVMPAYNAEKTIAKAIESILQQSYKNLRLIIVDDCSTDRTSRIAYGYLTDPRVSLFKNKTNMGAYYCRNVGLYLNKDKTWGYFTTHDADDISFKSRYSRLIGLLRLPRFVAAQDIFKRTDFYTGEELGRGLTMAHAVFNRKVLGAIGYFEHRRFGADWEYWQRLNAWNKINNYKTAAVHELLGESFIHDKNLTVQIPIGSQPRVKYISDVRRRMIMMSNKADYYYEFNKDIFCTEEVL